jgi:hypothetical protein
MARNATPTWSGAAGSPETEVWIGSVT